MNTSEDIVDFSVLPYGSIPMSAKKNLGIDVLKREILRKFREEFIFCTLFVPYAQMNEYQSMKDFITERKVEFTDDGAKIEAVIPIRYGDQLSPFITEYKN